MTEAKQRLTEMAMDRGVELVGVADVTRWETIPRTDPAFWPRNIWPWCTRVLVLGARIFLPMTATTPSALNGEMYNTSNRVLDDTAYRLAVWINRQGYRAFFFPRDCYGNPKILNTNPRAAFSQALAGYYAGLGTIGYHHMLITPEVGPRLRLVSVITDMPLEPDPMLEKELCIRCGLCAKECPSGALKGHDANDPRQADMDRIACALYHDGLGEHFCVPCGVCANVCPVGADRTGFRTEPPVSPDGIRHVQSYGSRPFDKAADN